MNNDLPAPLLQILQRQTVIFQPTFIDVISGTVRKSGRDHCRNGVDNEFKASFGLLPVLDIGSRTVPPYDTALFIVQRVETN